MAEACDPAPSWFATRGHEASLANRGIRAGIAQAGRCDVRPDLAGAISGNGMDGKPVGLGERDDFVRFQLREQTPGKAERSTYLPCNRDCIRRRAARDPDHLSVELLDLWRVANPADARPGSDWQRSRQAAEFQFHDATYGVAASGLRRLALGE